MPPDPKQKRYQNKDYLDFIRMQDCYKSGDAGPNDPHHVISKGAGGDDTMTIPLNRKYHNMVDQIIDKNDPLVWRKMVEYLTKYLRNKN